MTGNNDFPFPYELISNIKHLLSKLANRIRFFSNGNMDSYMSEFKKFGQICVKLTRVFGLFSKPKDF